MPEDNSGNQISECAVDLEEEEVVAFVPSSPKNRLRDLQKHNLIAQKNAINEFSIKMERLKTFEGLLNKAIDLSFKKTYTAKNSKIKKSADNLERNLYLKLDHKNNSNWLSLEIKTLNELISKNLNPKDKEWIMSYLNKIDQSFALKKPLGSDDDSEWIMKKLNSLKSLMKKRKLGSESDLKLILKSVNNLKKTIKERFEKGA